MPERRLVISDASPLIALADIGRLELLEALYDTVYITDVVSARDKCQPTFLDSDQRPIR